MTRAHPFVLLAVVSLFVPGCGGKMGTVHIKLTFKGEPVTAGSIIFMPEAPDEQFEAGRPAEGAPDENGELQLSTHKLHDGALVGRHKVAYRAPGVPSTIDPEIRAKHQKNFDKYGKCRLPADTILEVKPGKNEFTLELIE